MVGEEIKTEQRGLDVVDSFSISVTLMLAVVGFTKVFRRWSPGRSLLEEVDRAGADGEHPADRRDGGTAAQFRGQRVLGRRNSSAVS
jgi:hypothetical protein